MTDKSCNSGHLCFQQVCGSLHWRFLNQSDLLSATVPHSWCHMWLQFLCLLLCAQEHDGHSQSLYGEDALLQKPMLLLLWMISPPYHPQSPAHHHSYALKMDSFFFTMPLCANHNEYKTLFTYLHKYRRKNKLLKLAVHGSFQGQGPMTAIMLFITYKMNLNTPQSANVNPWFEATNSGNKIKIGHSRKICVHKTRVKNLVVFVAYLWWSWVWFVRYACTTWKAMPFPFHTQKNYCPPLLDLPAGIAFG